MARRTGERRQAIERMLVREERVFQRTGRRVPNFRKLLAKKFRVSKQRVTNIARDMGLTKRPRVKKEVA